MTPRIGITCRVRRWDGADELALNQLYARAVERAGGHPVPLAIVRGPAAVRRTLQGLDGLVLTGGEDLDPGLYGEKRHPETRTVSPERQAFELALYRAARRRRLPTLAICLGMQLVNVAEGGSLIQHLAPSKVRHGGRKGLRHPVRPLPGTRLAALLGSRPFPAPSSHHQAVRRLGRGLRPAALAADGVVEALERPGEPELLAVQWHPERAPGSRATERLFRSLVRACGPSRRRLS